MCRSLSLAASSLAALCVLLFGFTSSPVRAEDPSAAPAVDAAPPLTVSGIATLPNPSEPKESEQHRARIGDSIVLTTSSGLDDYLRYAANHKKAISLFLDGIDTGIGPEAIDRKNATVRFHLERNADNKNVWASLLRDPFNHPTRSVDASIGFTGGAAVPAADNPVTFTLLVVYWAWYAWAWLLLLIVLLASFGWLVVKRSVLRDGPKPAPHSLGRTQMAWWFLLIVTSYVMIWLISGDRDTITPSLLVLMGISAGTALGSVLIDTRASVDLSQAASDRLALQAAQQNAQQALSMAQAAGAAAPADLVVQKNLADAKATSAVADAKLLAINNTINGVVVVPQSRGFIRDLLSDSEGTAALHRFQIVVWTIVLGIIFVVSVLTNLSMPEFSSTLLATMGISAGTYLGFKLPEK